MLRLLFCSAALLPVAIIPWVGSKASAPQIETETAELVSDYVDPDIVALTRCETGELPVFFHEDLLTVHSAEYLTDGLDAADKCGDIDVTIVPVLPAEYDSQDISQSLERTAELQEIMRAEGLDAEIGKNALEDDVSALYINGRAAIVRIEP